jgi:hypothetical protein
VLARYLSGVGYYQGCELTIEVPRTGNYDLAAITKALVAEMPGLKVKVRQPSLIPYAVEAYVPDGHGLAAAGEEVGGKLAPTGGRTLLMIAEDVLSKFKPS